MLNSWGSCSALQCRHYHHRPIAFKQLSFEYCPEPKAIMAQSYSQNPRHVFFSGTRCVSTSKIQSCCPPRKGPLLLQLLLPPGEKKRKKIALSSLVGGTLIFFPYPASCLAIHTVHHFYRATNCCVAAHSPLFKCMQAVVCVLSLDRRHKPSLIFKYQHFGRISMTSLFFCTRFVSSRSASKPAARRPLLLIEWKVSCDIVGGSYSSAYMHT